MALLDLFATFFKIGLFSFGGGYGMIRMIQDELQRHGWLSPAQFIDIIAIAEMTPGPIAVNSATFVGYRVAGFLGALAATVGVALPSMLLIFFVSGFFFRYRAHPLQRSVFRCIRPAVTALIAAAAIGVAQTAFLRENVMETHQTGSAAAAGGAEDNLPGALLSMIQPVPIVLFGLFLFLLLRKKLHPVLLIGIAAATGITVYWLAPLLWPGTGAWL